MLILDIEMSAVEQLLNSDLNHIRPRHGSNPQAEPDMVSSQLPNSNRTREHAEVDEQHEELYGI